jgi:hypothetical protein
MTIKEYLPKQSVKDKIIAVGRGACCSPDCLQDYALSFRTDATVEPFLANVDTVSGIQIEGVERIFFAPINITTDSGLLALIDAIDRALFVSRFQGDSIKIELSDLGVYSLIISDCEAILGYLMTDVGNLLFNAPETVSDCDCYTDEPPLPPVPPIGDSCLVCSDTPPTNTAKLWRNNLDGLTYFYDGANWVSTSVYNAEFSRGGNWPNGAFLQHGNTATSDTIGAIFPVNAKLESVSLRGATAAGDIRIWSNGVNVLDFAFAGTANQVIPIALTRDQAQSLSFQKLSGTASNIILIAFYRKRYV